MNTKKMIIIALALILLIGAVTVLPIHGEAEIFDAVIRLHVQANSNSPEDQALKLQVRDAVLAAARPLLANAKTREEARAILSDTLEVLRAAAERTVRAAGVSDKVSISLGNESYPTREYEALAFPAGEYLSLRIMIGEAKGENWWCVLFPPLCLSAATDKQTAEAAFLAAGLSEEQYRIITETDNTKYKLRFKLLELAEELFS